MSLSSRLLLVLSLILVSAAPAADGPRLDAHGDPLPDGALARLGTARFRGGFQGMALSPDGKTLAVGLEQSLRLVEIASGKEIKKLESDRGFYSVTLAFAPDGKTLAGRGHGGGIHLWDVASGRRLRQLGGDQPSRAAGLVFSADSRLAAAGAEYSGQQQPTIRVWEVATGKETAAVQPLQNHNVRVALSADGKVLATWGHFIGRGENRDEEMRRVRTVQLWDTATGKERKKLELAPHYGVSAVALSPDGKRAVVSTSGMLSEWDLETGKEVGQFAARRSTHTCFYSPDGKLLVGLAYPLVVQVWDAATGRRLGLHEIRGTVYPGGYVVPVTFASDGRLLALTSTGQAISVWDVRAEKRLTPSGGHETGVVGLAFADGGKQLHSISSEGVVCRWDVAGGRERSRRQLQDEESARYHGGGRGRFQTAAVSPDGRYLLSHDSSNTVLWELATGREVCWFATGHSSYQGGGMSFSEGGRVALGGRDPRGQGGVVSVYDVGTGRRVAALAGALEELTGTALAPDGKTVAAASLSHRAGGCALRAWDVATGKDRWSRGLETRRVARVAFSPDGATLAVADQTAEVALVSAATGEEQRRLTEPGVALYWAAFSPDGRTLAAVGQEQQDRSRSVVLVWELATGTLRQRLTGHALVPMCLAFSPDGTVLATGGHDTAVLLWDLTGRLGRAKPKAPPGERELEALWADLDAPDAKTAHAALAQLHLLPAEAVALLARRLPPVQAAKADAAAIAGLVADLDHARFARRDQARRQLEELGSAAAAELRKGLEGKPSAEMKKAIQELLQKLETAATKPEWVRPIRAVELLERLRTPEARTLLEKLSTGAPAARLTQEARASLRRLNTPRSSP